MGLGQGTSAKAKGRFWEGFGKVSESASLFPASLSSKFPPIFLMKELASLKRRMGSKTDHPGALRDRLVKGLT